MEIFLSFSTKLNKNLKEARNSQEELRFTVRLFKICVYFLNKLNYNVNIITDNDGYNALKHLKVNSITKDLESVRITYPEAWSITKLYVYNKLAKRKKPFIHIDHDFFLLKPLEEELLRAEVVVQTFEYNINRLSYYVPEFNQIACNKYHAEGYDLNYAYNCGIIGGTNYEFFEEYSKTAIQLIEDPANRNFFELFSGQEKLYWAHVSKATIPEQYYLACCLEKFKIKPYLFFDNSAGFLRNNLTEKGIYNYNLRAFYHFYNKKAVHFMGHNKRLTEIQNFFNMFDEL